MRTLNAILACSAALGVSAAVAPAAGASAPALRVSVGGKVARSTTCGHRARVHHVLAGRRIPIRVAPAKKATVKVERCVLGKWRKAGGLDARRRGQRIARAFTKVSAATDLRIRAVARHHRASRRIYLAGIVPSVGPGGPGSTDDVVTLPLSFQVKNENGSALSCSSDGKTYTVHGHLIAPASVLAQASPAVTLYLHEFGFGEWFWHFPVPAYDYATQQAASGHASVTIDRLGYDSSPGPDGNNICIGSQADMAHQIILQLRGGGYGVTGGSATKFAKVGLAGHSIGGLVAEVEAYSFGDIDALTLFGWADSGFSNDVTTEGAKQGMKCGQGGEPADPGGPSGYAYFASSPEKSQALLFHDADPDNIARALALRNRDPCGDANSEVPGIILNNTRIADITVPILLIMGANDAGFSDPHSAGEQQKGSYSSSKDVTLEDIPDTGHAYTLERSAPQTRAKVSAWLRARGF